MAALLVSASLGWLTDDREVILILGAMAMLTLLGITDDRWQLSVRLRLLAQLCIVAGVLWGLQTGTTLSVSGWWLLPALVAVVGLMNQFNFMDGIDGIAGQQMVFYALAYAVLRGADLPQSELLLMSAAACLGFLFWNWPPARLFMGDAGSLPLGFLMAVCIPLDYIQGHSVVLPLILWTSFGVDATLTLLLRVVRRERFHQAHRQHLYQRLSRVWGSHRSVTLLYAMLNVLWVLPLAIYSMQLPEVAGWGLLMLAWGGPSVLYLWLVAGRLRHV